MGIENRPNLNINKKAFTACAGLATLGASLTGYAVFDEGNGADVALENSVGTREISSTNQRLFIGGIAMVDIAAFAAVSLAVNEYLTRKYPLDNAETDQAVASDEKLVS